MSMETQTNGFIWTLLTRQITKKRSNKKLKNNLIKNKIERANTELNRESDSTKPQSQTKMFSRRKKTILSFTLSLFYLFVAPVMQVLPVYSAEPAAALTVWDIILTELVGSNAIITDTAVLSAYSSVLGDMAAATANAGAINTALAAAAQSCGVDLAPLFANTVESAASIGVTAVAATAGENIAATSIAAAAIPSAAVVPALGGAVVAGVGLGFLYNHICNKVAEFFEPAIRFCLKLKNANILDQYPIPSVGGYGGVVYSEQFVNQKQTLYSNAYVSSADNKKLVIYNPSGFQNAYELSVRQGTYKWRLFNNVSYGLSEIGIGIELSGPVVDVQAARNALNGIGTYEPPLNYSPDLASTTGFLHYDPIGNNETLIPHIPELQPLPDYANGYGLKPITEADYSDIVTYINSYPDPNSFQSQEEQQEDFPSVINPIIDPYMVPVGDPGGNPGGDPGDNPGTDPQPTGTPNPNPNPGQSTQPYPNPEQVPQVTPGIQTTPDKDIAPETVPYPEPATPTQQDEDDTNDKITPYDLRDKFPFCIPFDILKIMKLFQGGREAPCFTWSIPFGQAGSSSVTVDLSPWDSAATLCRTLELILFIMLLAVATRNLIGGSS